MIQFALKISVAALAMALLAVPASARVTGEDAKTVERISNHFSSVPTMTGEFIQFGPKGEQTQGKFYLSRPGRIRFDYDKPSAITVKADGKTVGISNRKLKTWDYIPLRKTPLRLLLADRIDVNDRSIKSVKHEADLTTVVLADKKMFGASKITLMFDPKTFDLRQWTITDDQGKDTSVMIFNVQKNKRLSRNLFKFDYKANARAIEGRNNN